MRNAFVKKITEISRINQKIVLLVGDIGYGVFESFKKEFPKRYFNLGIAEQNSIGVVSGLAKEGFFPIFYTIIPFLLFRPFEQIRNDLCINRRHCLLVGVGGGLSYGALGPTHHALEDIGAMSILPEISIYTPSTPKMVELCLDEAISTGSGPSYLRLGKNGESELSSHNFSVTQWMPIRVKNPNKKILILSHGSISKFAEEAVDLVHLPKLITFGVFERLKPFPFDEFFKVVKGADLILTIEEHYIIGGLYDKILQAAHELDIKSKIQSISVPHRFITEVGSQEDLLTNLALNVSGLARRISEAVSNA